jgi:simple sugar transport system substrate-binding protein
MKKLFPFVAALALLGSAFASAGNGPVVVDKVRKDIATSVTKKKYTIATVVKVDGIAWFDRMRVGVEQFKKDQGHDTFMVGPSQADAAAQVQIIENLIAQKVDAICVVPFSVEAVEPVLKKGSSLFQVGDGVADPREDPQRGARPSNRSFPAIR